MWSCEFRCLNQHINSMDNKFLDLKMNAVLLTCSNTTSTYVFMFMVISYYVVTFFI